MRINTDESLLFTDVEEQEEEDSDIFETGQVLRGTSWKPLKSPADKDWVKSKQTEEEEWLESLKVPKEWLPGNLQSDPFSPLAVRHKKPKGNPIKSDKPEGSQSGWYLLSNHHQGFARGIAMTLNNR